jgi:peptidoglycan/xylan/chitin deacetylase (PgdA/CDA1 family)
MGRIALGLLAAAGLASCDGPASTARVGRQAHPLETVTTISLTFDDTFADQFGAARLLSAHGMHGTFFVNSGRVNLPGYMTQGQLLTIQQDGHEIGGHTV